MKKFLTSILCPLLFTIFTTGIFAATYTVNQPDDFGDGVCDTTCTLRDAVIAANTTEPLDDEIIFVPNLSTIVLNSEIQIDQAGHLMIRGPGADRLTIDGGPGSNRIFYTFSSAGFSSDLQILDLTLTGGNGFGTGINGWGGAIYANTSSLLLERIHITGNSASTGGGIYYNATGLRIFNSTISNNTATANCGGFENRGDGLHIVNSTISGNTAGGAGGGFCHLNSGTVDSATISDNTALNGGGLIQNPGTLSVRNSIVAGNNSSGGGAPEIYRTNFPNPANFLSEGHNLIGDDAGDSADTNVPITYQSTDIRDTSPQVIALGNFGGTTPTHALQFNSPAKDAADPSGTIDLDQRGFEREFGAADIGAFEIQNNSRWYVTQPNDDNGPCDENCSLREAINAVPVGGFVEFSSDLSASTPIIVNLNEIVIDKNLTIAGPGADKIIITTDFSDHRIFFVLGLDVTISGVTLTGGAASQGGAIYSSGFLTVDGVHFLNNGATGQGGAIFYSPFSFQGVIRNSTFSGNDAPGGGFYCDGTGTNTLPRVTVVNSTFTSNLSVSNGPAFTNNRCNVTARNITVSGNTGINNGGIFVTSNGTLDIGNSIVSGNTATTPNPALLRPEISIFAGGSVTSAGNNLVGDSAGDAANTGTPIVYQVSDILDTPPLLGPLQNNGGPTPTLELLVGSPAIDTGDNAKAVIPENNSQLMSDQRGFLRYLGFPAAIVDIGAFEYGSAASWSSATPIGMNVSVSAGPVTINYAGVSVPGNTTVTPIDPATAGQLPDGFTLGPGYPAFEISTSAAYSAPLIVCIQAPAVLTASEFIGLSLFHYENGDLVDRTSSRNFAAKTVCASVSNLSPFVVARSLAPTAANVSVSGRIISSNVRGVSNAKVSITNPLTGQTFTVLSSSFGYYRITDIPSGSDYVLSARHKFHRFTSRVLVVNDDISDADLVAEPGPEDGKQKE